MYLASFSYTRYDTYVAITIAIAYLRSYSYDIKLHNYRYSMFAFTSSRISSLRSRLSSKQPTNLLFRSFTQYARAYVINISRLRKWRLFKDWFCAVSAKERAV